MTTAFSKLLSKLGISRTGVGYYSLRRTFATIASSSRDSVAVDLIMGHLDASVAARYRSGSTTSESKLCAMLSGSGYMESDLKELSEAELVNALIETAILHVLATEKPDKISDARQSI